MVLGMYSVFGCLDALGSPGLLIEAILFENIHFMVT